MFLYPDFDNLVIVSYRRVSYRRLSLFVGGVLLLPCEIIVRQYLPAVRASVAKRLAARYGMDQREIASCLGLTQPAVNKYLASRYGKEVKVFEHSKGLEKLVEKLAGDAARRSGPRAQLLVLQGICASCKELRSRGPVCMLHKESIPLSAECALCMR